MIISMRPHATKQEVENVKERIQEFGFRVHSIEGEERVVIGVVGVGGDVEACLESLEATPGVEKAMRISAPYKFVSKEFRKDRTVIRVGRAEIGGDEFITMAGPCSVESEKQIMETAEAVAAEVMSDRDVDLVAEYTDVMQIGARNMQNFALLKALGRCGRPVLLKRGLSSTIKELLMSAEYVVAHGNSQVMLCERGIRTFETATRNTCDISAVPVLNEMTHLPVIVDPSHAAG